MKQLYKFHDSEPDRDGRRRFALWWASNGYLRGQEFRAVPEQYGIGSKETMVQLSLMPGEDDAQAAIRMLGGNLKRRTFHEEA